MKSEHHCKESTNHKIKLEKRQNPLHYANEKVPHTCQPLIKSRIFNDQTTGARHGEQLPEYKLALPARNFARNLAKHSMEVVVELLLALFSIMILMFRVILIYL